MYVRKTLAKKRNSGGRGEEGTDGGDGGKVLRDCGTGNRKVGKKGEGREDGGRREGKRGRGDREREGGREGEISFFTLCSGVRAAQPISP